MESFGKHLYEMSKKPRDNANKAKFIGMTADRCMCMVSVNDTIYTIANNGQIYNAKGKFFESDNPPPFEVEFVSRDDDCGMKVYDCKEYSFKIEVWHGMPQFHYL
jgi:hypothetical protein